MIGWFGADAVGWGKDRVGDVVGLIDDQVLDRIPGVERAQRWLLGSDSGRAIAGFAGYMVKVRGAEPEPFGKPVVYAPRRGGGRIVLNSRPAGYVVTRYDARGDVAESRFVLRQVYRRRGPRHVVVERLLAPNAATANGIARTTRMLYRGASVTVEEHRIVRVRRVFVDRDGALDNKVVKLGAALAMAPLCGGCGFALFYGDEAAKFVKENPVSTAKMALGAAMIFPLGPLTGGASATIGTGLVVAGIGDVAAYVAREAGAPDWLAEGIGVAASACAAAAMGGVPADQFIEEFAVGAGKRGLKKGVSAAAGSLAEKIGLPPQAGRYAGSCGASYALDDSPSTKCDPNKLAAKYERAASLFESKGAAGGGEAAGGGAGGGLSGFGAFAGAPSRLLAATAEARAVAIGRVLAGRLEAAQVQLSSDLLSRNPRHRARARSALALAGKSQRDIDEAFRLAAARRDAGRLARVLDARRAVLARRVPPSPTALDVAAGWGTGRQAAIEAGVDAAARRTPSWWVRNGNKVALVGGLAALGTVEARRRRWI